MISTVVIVVWQCNVFDLKLLKSKNDNFSHFQKQKQPNLYRASFDPGLLFDPTTSVISLRHISQNLNEYKNNKKNRNHTGVQYIIIYNK